MNLPKIRLMTILAMYDKKDGRKDRHIQSFYRQDYIYRKNLVTRLLVLCGFCIAFGFYMFYGVFVRDGFLENLQLKPFIAGVLLVLAAILAFYTVLGRRLAGKEYDRAEQRQDIYEKMLDVLEKMQEAQAGGEGNAADGTAAGHSRPGHRTV